MTTLWPVLGALGAAGGTGVLARTLWPRRGAPGASWLLAVLAVQFVLTVGYGVGYLVFTPVLRLAVEMLFWVAYIWLGTLFVAFGLSYTGRGDVIYSPWFAVVSLFSLVLTGLVVTNPLHELVWEGFRVVPAQGLATVAFQRNGLALLILGVTALGASIGTLLLVDTVISYGRLYRGEAIAIAFSPLPPGVGFVLWTFDVGPIPGLNVAPVLFLLHVALDAYAFIGSGMFEFHPATRRVGNRAAIADLGNPVIVIDDRHRVVNLNATAESVFGVSDQYALTRPLSACLDADDIDPARSEQDVTVRVDRRERTFKLTSTDLSDGQERHLGYTLVFQDITEERQREQRLAVLNRALRHNLRNDLNVVRLHLDNIADHTGETLAPSVETARSNVAGLVALGEKARSFERASDAGTDELVAVGEAVRAVVADVREAAPEVTVEVTGTDSALVRTDHPMLEVVLSNLVENAVEHGTPRAERDGPPARADGEGEGEGESESGTNRPDVRAEVTASERAVTVTVEDWGPGIPEHELSVIEDGDESALEHGSGLGLWLVAWGATAIGGDLSFDTGADGTTATLRLPVVEDDPARRS